MDNPIEDKLLVLPYSTRFDNEYRKKLIAKIEPIKKLNIRCGVHLTLTSQPSRFPSLKEEYRALMRNWNRLNAYFTKIVGKTLKVRVVEFTKEGHPHLHIIFLGIDWLGSWEKIKALWDKYGSGFMITVQRITQRQNMFRYILKYISKTIDLSFKIKDRYTESLVLGWALGVRTLAFSLLAGIRIIKTRNQEPGARVQASTGVGGHSKGGFEGENVSPPSDFRASNWIYLGSHVHVPIGLFKGAERLNILSSLS